MCSAQMKFIPNGADSNAIDDPIAHIALKCMCGVGLDGSETMYAT
jgi:hypothetical protein